MVDVTFRDFAGAVMAGDAAKASSVLSALLRLDEPSAHAAAEHFLSRSKADPTFMMKAMGLRSAVESGNDDQIRSLLGECFGLEGEPATTAVAALRRK
jgi:hypothetical protein